MANCVSNFNLSEKAALPLCKPRAAGRAVRLVTSLFLAAGLFACNGCSTQTVEHAAPPKDPEIVPAPAEPSSPTASSTGAADPAVTARQAEDPAAEHAKSAADDGEGDRTIIKQMAKQYAHRNPKPDPELQQPPDPNEMLKNQELAAANMLSIGKEELAKGHKSRAKNYFTNIVEQLPQTKPAEEARKLLEGL